MKIRPPHALVLAVLFAMTMAIACDRSDSHCRSQIKNLAAECESFISDREEERWKQVSLAIGNVVIREIFLGKRNEHMHIALTIDHFMSAREIAAIGVQIKEKGDFQPFIAIWRDQGLVRKTGREAVVPERIAKASTAADTVIDLKGSGGGTSIRATVFYSPEAVMSWMQNQKKIFGAE